MMVTILWDGDCGFCRRAVRWALDHDRSGTLEATPWQSAASPPMTPALERACAKAVHVLEPERGTSRAGRACLRVLSLCGHPVLAGVLGVRPLIWGVELGYWLVARNRRVFSRILFRG